MSTGGIFKTCKCANKDRCQHQWQLRTRVAGKRLVVRSARVFGKRAVTTRTEAKALLPSFYTAARQGKLGETKDPTMWEEFIQLFEEKYVKARGLHFAADQQRLEVLKERWKAKLMKDVLARPKYFDDFLSEKHELKPATRNRYRALFRRLVNFAERRDLIEENPWKRAGYGFEKEKNQRSIRLNREQEEAVWHAMGPWLKGLFIAAMDTGLRAETLLSLRWADVDREQKILTVKASIQKDGEPIKLPISGRLDAILEMREVLALGPDKFVFGTDRGFKRKTFRDAWKKALMEAGLGELDIHWHDLRGEFASRLSESGVSLRDIQTILGHSSISVTERYLRPRVSAFEDAFKKLEKGQPELRLLTDGNDNQATQHDPARESRREESKTRH